MSSIVTVRRGYTFNRTFDTYTDTARTERIDYDDWRFELTLCGLVFTTDDTDPKLTVEAATDPDGSRLRLDLDAGDTSQITVSSGHLAIAQVDPQDPENRTLIALAPVVVA